MNAWNTLLSGAGVLIAAVAVLVALDARVEPAAASTREAPPPDTRIRELEQQIRELRQETRFLRTEVAARPATATGAAAVEPAAEPNAPAEAATDLAAQRAELFSLGKKVLARTATADDQARFWELARSAGMVDGLLETLEAEVAAAPKDAEARMRLADAYVIKLFTVPAGPEMGLWGGKAEAEWRKVLEFEPAHWQARFNLAVSLSYHPDVEGVTPDAIRHLTRLAEQQESHAPEPRQADVYRLLATLHRRQGDADAARKAIERGLARHPEDEKLRRAAREDGR